MPPYRKSPALRDWTTVRRANVTELERAHSLIGHAGPGAAAGRPRKAGTQQINEALVLRVVTEFQGYVREILDLAAIGLVRGAGCGIRYQPQLIAAASRDRQIDRGNPHLAAIASDAKRLGIPELRKQMQLENDSHAIDAPKLQRLVEMRNALAHDDQDRLLELSRN